MQNDDAKREFMVWLKKNDPFLYGVAIKRYEQNQSGLGGINWGDLFSSTLDTVKNVGTSVLQYKQQKKIIDMQMDRAKRGEPPLDIDDYTPSIKIAPVLTPETEAAMTRVATQTTANVGQNLSKMAVPIGLGLLAFMLFRR